MTTTRAKNVPSTDNYRLIIDLWQKERIASRNEFAGFLIVMAILILVSLGGAWWPPLLGVVFSVIWIVLSGRTVSSQTALFNQLESIHESEPDDPVFSIHQFERSEVKLPVSFLPSALINKYAPLLITGTPVLFTAIWIIGFIVSLVTTVVT